MDFFEGDIYEILADILLSTRLDWNVINRILSTSLKTLMFRIRDDNTILSPSDENFQRFLHAFQCNASLEKVLLGETVGSIIQTTCFQPIQGFGTRNQFVRKLLQVRWCNRNKSKQLEIHMFTPFPSNGYISLLESFGTISTARTRM
jgi:hypothetical protein